MENQAVELIGSELQTRIESGVSLIMSGVESITIQNQEHLVNAATLTKEIKITGKLIEDERKKIVSPLNNQVSEVNAYFKKFASMLDTAETTLKKAIMTYQAEQERIRIEAQRKADEEARKERERIERAAREQREREDAALRKEEEARQAAVEAQRKADEAANAEDRARLEAEAAQKRKESEAATRAALAAAEKASTKEAIAETIIAPVIDSNYRAPSGSYNVTTYTGEVEDKAAFAKYCLDNGQLNFITIDVGQINKILQASKGARRMPGIKIIKSTSLRMKSR